MVRYVFIGCKCQSMRVGACDAVSQYDSYTYDVLIDYLILSLQSYMLIWVFACCFAYVTCMTI